MAERPEKAKRGNGEGSLFEKQDPHRWVAVVTLPDGRRRTWYRKTKGEASAMLRDALHELAKGSLPGYDRRSVAQYLDDWLATTKPNLRHSVWTRYGEYIRLHVPSELGKKRLAHLTARDLQELYAEELGRGLSPTTVRHLHSVLHRALAQAVRWGLLSHNPSELTDPPKRATERRPTLSAEEAERFMAAVAGHHLEALFVCALTLGMRQGELCGLPWSAIDFDRGTLSITQTLAKRDKGFGIGEPKTPSSRRTLRLNQRAASALRRRRQIQREERLAAGPGWQESGLVFTRSDGRPLASQHIAGDVLTPLLAQAGLPHVRFHDLRHTFATLGLRQRVPLRIISDALGHASIGISADLYSHVTSEMQAQVSDAFDELFGP